MLSVSRGSKQDLLLLQRHGKSIFQGYVSPTHPWKGGHMTGGRYLWSQVSQKCGSVQNCLQYSPFQGPGVFLARTISHVYL